MTQTTVPTITVAGRIVQDPFGQLARYARWHRRTILRYDCGSAMDANRVTMEEIARTRAVRSRIGRREGEQLIRACIEVADVLAAIPPTAHLRDADPAVHGGLYDQALTVFDQLLAPGIQYGKVSKILHLKRPHLFPILDSHLTRTYRAKAEQAAVRLRAQRPGYQRLYWAAIRDDVMADGNVLSLTALRGLLQKDPDPRVQQLAVLSDVRLLDILTW